MFALIDRATGDWILSTCTGTRLTYTSRHLAILAAKWVGKDPGIYVTVVDA